MPREPLKLCVDPKSPHADLAAQPTSDPAERYAVELRWLPFQLRIKGKGERSVYSEWKVRYSYLDARRWANRRGGFPIRGPRKVYDSAPALIGGLYAEQQGFFRDYTLQTFARFFDHKLELDDPDQVAGLIAELDGDGADYLDWSKGEGAQRLEASIDDAYEDHIFGVPIFVLRDEPFWGHDRIPLLGERLVEYGLD